MPNIDGMCKHSVLLTGYRTIALDCEAVPAVIQDWAVEHCMGVDQLPDLWVSVDFSYNIYQSDEDSSDERMIESVTVGGLYPIEYELPNTLWHHLEDEVASVIITNEGSYHGD